MTPERKEKWLADLRSGAFPKTCKRLKDGAGYCCLGVLMVTQGPAECVESQDPYDAELQSGQELSAARGLDHFELERYAHDTLVNLNDTNETFDPVIEWIEKNL